MRLFDGSGSFHNQIDAQRTFSHISECTSSCFGSRELFFYWLYSSFSASLRQRVFIIAVAQMWLMWLIYRRFVSLDLLLLARMILSLPLSCVLGATPNALRYIYSLRTHFFVLELPPALHPTSTM